MYLAKIAPPFEPGTLVITKNDLTYLGRTKYSNLGTSSHTSHENFQYPAGTVLMIVGVERKVYRGWKYKFMTSDRGVLESDFAHFKSWKGYLNPA